MSHPNPRNVCDGCGQTLDRRRRGHVLLGPIVHDEIWRRLAKPTEALCWQCMLRAHARSSWTHAAARRSAAVSLEPFPSALFLARPVRGDGGRCAAGPTSRRGVRPGVLSASPAMGAAPARSRRPGGVAMTDNSEPKIIPFGKYKGRLVEGRADRRSRLKGHFCCDERP